MESMVTVLEKTFKLVGAGDHAVEAKVSSLWNSSPELREEFGDVESATAYYKAVAAGRVKILRGPSNAA